MGSLSRIDTPLKYPKARRDECVIDNYHGCLVSDPYRWYVFNYFKVLVSILVFGLCELVSVETRLKNNYFYLKL